MTPEEKRAKKRARKKKSEAAFNEFKNFIAKGNVVDMAVGIIIGGAFTAIVTALTNGIFKPFIDWLIMTIVGTNDLSDILTFLYKATDETGAVILEKSIYIDWGTLINAVINFLLIALILFALVKLVSFIAAKKKAIKAKALEDYYKKHPEERPVVLPPEAPKPSTEELLTAILAEIRKDKK